MQKITAGIVARILLTLLAGVLAKAGYDAAQQQALAETVAQAVVAIAMAGGSTFWAARSRSKAVETAVVATKIATLAEPELNRATLGTPDAGRPINPASPARQRVTLSLLNSFIRKP